MFARLLFSYPSFLSLLSFLSFLLVQAASTRAADTDNRPQFQRLKYNHPGLTVDLGVGLWAWPLPMDYDSDGDFDLVVSCPDVPNNGTYFFENPGGDSRMPIFKPAVRLGPGFRNITVSHPAGQPRVLIPANEFTGFLAGDLTIHRQLYPEVELRVPKDGLIRANQWSYVDFDGDDALDLIVGHGWWGDYGWDNAFNEQGQWTRGPLHGNVYLLRNNGTSEDPQYAAPMLVEAGEQPVDVFGMPSPNFADFDGDGDLDLVCGEFLDGFTYFQNIGSRTEPRYAAGCRLTRRGHSLNMPLCMIVVSAIDWDRDGDVDLVVGQEDGRVALVEHTGDVADGMPVFAEPRFFQQQADEVKFGVLVTPVSFDWDGDGDEDLVCGNSAGEIGFLENLNGANPPRWAAPVLLTAGNQPIRIMAGPNGSIQGPAEAKWGYTTISVADWDHDELPDIVANSIWGKVVWYRNSGTRTSPRLAAAQPVQVRWPAAPPKPQWTWWQPEAEELATQWRTTPCVTDWNADGLNDLVMLDHEGFLALFRRQREDGVLVLRPGQRVFAGGTYDSQHRPQPDSSESLRLNNGFAGKSGRRKLCIIDFNRDGKLDILVNSASVNLLTQLAVQDGRFIFQDVGPLCRNRLAGHTTSPTTTDWDGDGQRQLLIGAEDGYFYYNASDSPPAR